MKKETELVKNNYKKEPGYEWKRLVQDEYHSLEFDTTMSFLEKHLPKKGLILDAGGGPGRYTIELAKRGYKIYLLDLVEENINLAIKNVKKKRLTNNVLKMEVGNIVDLSIFEDNTFDAVLCLGGPLSHVPTEKYRNKAISELRRVAKNKAPIFVSVMGWYGALLATPLGWPQEVEDSNFDNLIKKGDDYKWRKDGYCHFFTLEEMEGLFDKNKIKMIERVALEGFNSNKVVSNKFAKDYPKGWAKWKDIHNKLCTNPIVVNLSNHMLLIGRK